MKVGYWLLILLFVFGISFYSGFSISSRTGFNEGYFNLVESAQYGGERDADIAKAEMDEDYKDYYQDLTSED